MICIISEIQAKRLQLDGDRGDRIERKRKSRFGDDEDTIPEKTLVPMVNISLEGLFKVIIVLYFYEC